MFKGLFQELINEESFLTSIRGFGNSGPFDHIEIPNFFNANVAKKLESEFPDIHATCWHSYDNAIELKKTCNSWNDFPAFTYKVFAFLNSIEFLEVLERELYQATKLYSDTGLNGGGWHIHGRDGKLNPHLDYSLHPKLRMQRKLNLIVYLNSKWQESWGGGLGLYDNASEMKPGELLKTVNPIFNTAILFDTTQNSWHGLASLVKCPEGEFRKSLAVYYLVQPEQGVSDRGKALFSPTPDQENDEAVLELIKLRSKTSSAEKVYKS